MSRPADQNVMTAARRRIVRTIMDATIGYVLVALFAHLLVHGGEVVMAKTLDTLHVGLLAIDLSATGQLVVRINMDTIRMIRRGR